MNISGKTRVCGVIGNPVGHSLSPIIHNAAFQHLRLDFVYLAFKVAAGQLENSMRGMRGLEIRGLNVTMPHKAAVIPFLDEVNESSKFLRSVNTILNLDGKLVGCSTDGEGAVMALRENKVKLSDKKVLLLGGGGAAKAITSSLSKEVQRITVLNRKPEKVGEIIFSLKQNYGRDVSVAQLSPESIRENLDDVDVLINATSVGMHPHEDESLVNPNWLSSEHVVMDIVYDPLETRLEKDAKNRGAKVISGLEMLIYQGASSFKLWTGKDAPIDVMRKAALERMKNLGEGNVG